MKSMKWAPFRQEDKRWRQHPMWIREKVIAVATEHEGKSPKEASSLIFNFENGNNIGAEGCLLCSLAMVIKLLYLDEDRDPVDPAILNKYAHKSMYYTLSGLFMVPIYTDLVRDFTDGQVQLCAKEEYPFAKELGSNASDVCLPSQSYLLRGYRALPEPERFRYATMLKIGTYDDTFASHYLLADPRDEGDVDSDDLDVLDPYQPGDQRKRPWRLTDAYKLLRAHKDVGPQLKKERIDGNLIQGVWIFASWDPKDRRLLMDSLAASCVAQSVSGESAG